MKSVNSWISLRKIISASDMSTLKNNGLVSLSAAVIQTNAMLVGFPHILESRGKSLNLRKEFFRPEKSSKMTLVIESHGIPPIGHDIF